MPNRIYYATQQVQLTDSGEPTGNALHGLQSVSVNSTFNLQQVFELSYLGIYENIEGLPNVEASLSKVLDGYPLISHEASKTATAPTLVARCVPKAKMRLTIYDDSKDSASGDAVSAMQCNDLYLSSLAFNFPLDGDFTEEVTYVGNDKLWKGDTRVTNPTATGRQWAISLTSAGKFGASDAPIGTGGVNRRENMIFGTGTASYPYKVSKLPTEIPGINANGYNVTGADGTYRAHIQSMSCRANINREDILEQGRFTPYYRSVQFPIEVTSEFQVLSTSGDMISHTEEGILGLASDACTRGGNIVDQTIQVATCEGTIVYLGTKNKLASVNYGGGDAGGGNVNVTYSYSTYNTMTVIHSGDPNPSGTVWYNSGITYGTNLVGG